MKSGALLCRLLLIAAVAFGVGGIILIGLRVPIIGCVALAGIIWRRTRRRFGTGYVYGTARVADFFTALRNDFFASTGLILGTAGYLEPPTRAQAVRCLLSPAISSTTACRMFLAAFHGRKWAQRSLIRLKTFSHIMVSAPTGRGKGVSIILPIMLSYNGSIVCTDPKPELFALTAQHRQKRFKHRIALIDPYLITGLGYTDAINPLDFIDPEAIDFLDACRDTANALVVRQEQEMQPHFNDFAEIALTGVIAYVCAVETHPERRNLQTVYAIVSSRQLFLQAIGEMQATPGFGGVLQRLGDTLSWLKDGSEEQSSVMTTIARHVGFLNSPAIAQVTSRTTVEPRLLRSNRMTLYLCVSHTRLVSNPAIMRLFLTTLIRALSSDGPDERNKVLFLLDEAGHLGRKLDILESAVTIMRGFGLRFLFIFQNRQQIRKSFGDPETFMGNMDSQLYFGLNSFEEAEAVSKRCGEYTEVTTTEADQTSTSRPTGGTGQEAGNLSHSTTITLSEVGRPIARADEVLRMPQDLAWLFHMNNPVTPVQLLRHYDHPAFRNGRSGVWDGLGFNGLLTSMCLLVVAAVLVLVGMNLPESGSWPQQPSSITLPFGSGQGGPAQSDPMMLSPFDERFFRQQPPPAAPAGEFGQRRYGPSRTPSVRQANRRRRYYPGPSGGGMGGMSADPMYWP